MSRDALVVGINQYQVLSSLGAPARDAEAIAQLLSDEGDFRVQRLPEIIADATPQVGERTGVSVAQLEAALVKLFKPSGPTVPETALFYFSGHGLQKPSGVQEAYLATSEANPQQGHFGLSLFWLQRLLRESPVRQRVIWLDCCHSGALLDLAEVDPGAQPGTSRFLMAASREHEVAYESLTSEYSVFTEAILEGLRPQRVASGVVSNHSLTDWVNNRLKGQLQQPLFENSGSEIWLTRAGASTTTAPSTITPATTQTSTTTSAGTNPDAAKSRHPQSRHPQSGPAAPLSGPAGVPAKPSLRLYRTRNHCQNLAASRAIDSLGVPSGRSQQR